MDERKLVLVVDDNPDHRTIAAALLTYAGYSVVQADTIAAAERMIAAAPPQLVIVDIDLPDRNGLEWVIELHSEPATAHLPIIVYTAYRDVYTLTLRHLDIPSIDKSDPPTRFLDRVAMVMQGRQ